MERILDTAGDSSPVSQAALRAWTLAPVPWRRLLGLVLAGAALLPAQPSSSVILSEPLAEWRDEIEAMGNREVIPVRVYYDTNRQSVVLPRDTPRRPVLLPYFQNTNFLKQLLAAHSLSVNQDFEGRTLHFVLLNMAREPEWGGHEDAVIANELGRVWLYARNYASPVYEGKADSCIAVLAAELVQHGLIRDELKRRGIDYDSYWLPLLELSMRKMRDGGPPVEEIPTCEIMSRLVLWLDVKRGLSVDEYPSYDHFLAIMKQRYPILERTVGELNRLLDNADLNDLASYEDVLQRTLHTMYGFVQLVLKRSE